MQINGATALIQALEDQGVKQVFGLPGVQNIEIYDALLASGIRHVLARHEQAAVHMADGYARVTGGVGVVLATSGPGATNTVTGIATAYMDSIPLVVITGQVATTSIGTDAFQEADITTITLPITKHSYLIKEVDELVPALFEAFYLAASGRPGPVLIDVPGNVAAAELVYRPPKTSPRIPSYKPTIKGNARQVKAAAELIFNAERPVLLAGGGVVSSQATDELVSLAERLAAPVATTLLAKGSISPTHPQNRGQLGVYGAPEANRSLQQADVVLAVGTRFSERVTGNATEFAPGAAIIHIDIDPAEIGKNVRVDVPIVGDAATVLHDLSERIEGLMNSAKSPALTKRLSAQQKSLATDEDFTPLYESFANNTTRQVYRLINEQLQELCSDRRELIITTDVGQHQLWASHLLEVKGPRRFITSGGLGTMGFGLPAALGVQLARPEALVLCVSGDGSFQMNTQEMATAAVQELPVKVAIINNQSHGLVRQWQELFLDERYSHTLLSKVPDYAKLAEAYGWQGRSIDAQAALTDAVADSVSEKGNTQSGGDQNVQGLQSSLQWLFSVEGPALLEIVVPTSDLLTPMVKPGASLTEVL